VAGGLWFEQDITQQILCAEIFIFSIENWKKLEATPSRSSGRSPTLGASVRSIPEIPTLMINAHRRNVFSRKRNLFETPDLYNAALTRGDLIERSTVDEFHGNYLITDACLFIPFQMIDKSGGNWN
jgi:hypothetical protein